MSINIKDLESSLFSSLSLSVFILFSAISIINMSKSRVLVMNKKETSVIVVGLLFISISFALSGIVEFSHQYYNVKEKVNENKFDYTQSIIYNILVALIILFEIIISINIIKSI